MSNSGFTRDEVILTLDALYSSENQRLSANSDALRELSDILHRLPIHDLSKRNNTSFRTPSGIAQQLNVYLRSCRLGEKSPHVGKMFFDVTFEYEDKAEAIHKIAEAIRRNEQFFESSFGSAEEDLGFPEGTLLGHLHHIVEMSAVATVSKEQCCEVCGIQPNLQYNACNDLLELHLLVPPEQIDGAKKYTTEHFMTVCPTCHAVLHRYRPWCSDKHCEGVLR